MATICQTALKIDPNYVAPRIAGAYCHARLALLEDEAAATSLIAKAQAAIEQSSAQHPNDERTYTAKSVIDIALGNYEAAIESARTALKTELDSPPACLIRSGADECRPGK